MNNHVRWGLVTLAAGVTCATLGHYVADIGWLFAYVAAVVFAFFGGMALDLNGQNK